MLADKAPIEIQNGRSPALYLKKIQKHLCQPMDRMYSCLELKVFTVKSCQLPVRRPEFSLTFWGFAGHFNP